MALFIQVGSSGAPYSTDPEYNVLFKEGVVAQDVLIGTITGGQAGWVYSFNFDDGFYGDAGGRFYIVGNQIFAKATTGPDGSALFNYETQALHQISIVAKNAAGQSVDEGLFGIYLDDENDAPTDLELTNATSSDLSVNENLGQGAVIGTLSELDEDRDLGGGDTISYSFTSNPGNKFAFDTVDGVTRVVTTGPLDFEANDPLLRSEVVNGVTRKYYEVTVRATDDGGANGGTPKFTEKTFKVYVNDVADTQTNQAPTFTVLPGQTSFEATDTGSPVNPFAGIDLADNENDVITLTISFLNADGALGNVTSGNGVTVTDNGVSGTNRMFTFVGTAADLETFLRNVTFNPTDRSTAGGMVTTQFSFTVNDAGHTASTYNNAVNVVTTIVGVNDAPTFAVVGQTSFFMNENGPAARPFVGIDLADDENDQLTLTISFANADGALGNVTSGNGVTVTDNGVSGTNRMFTFVGTAADLETFLRNVTFNPTERASGTVTTQFSFTVKDAGHTASTHANAVNVAATFVNDAPTFAVVGQTSFEATDTGSPVNPFGGIDLGDDENDQLTLTISFANADGALGNVTSGNNVTVTDNGLIGANRVFTFVGTAADLETFLRNVTFNPTDRSTAGGTVTTQFSFTVKDAGHTASSLTNAVNVVTTIVGVNDAPTFAVVGQTSFEATDTGSPVNPFGGIDLGDDENDQLTLTISFANADGALGNVTSGNNVTVTDNGLSGANRMFTFVGTAANLETFLRNVTFNPTDRSSAGADIITRFSFTLKDAGHTASVHNNAVEVVTQVVGVNDAPTFAVVGQTSFEATDRGGAIRPFGGIDLGDDENDQLTLTISFANADGALGNVTSGNGVTVTDNGVSGTNRMFTFVGRAADLENFLDALQFDPTDRNGADDDITTQFSFSVKDAGHTASVHNNAVNVVTKVVGANVAPVITGATQPVIKTVSDRTDLQPFKELTVQDAGNLRVVVKMDAPSKGAFTGGGGIYDEDAGTFTIEGSAFIITTALQALRFDARDKTAGSAAESTTFTITVEDDGGLIATNSNITVSATAPSIPPQNQAPKDIVLLSGGVVQELSGLNTPVATFGTTDPDDASGFVYSIVNADGRFAISNNQLVVANGVMLDFEQKTSHVVRVRAIDKFGTGLSYEEDITITVSDLSPEKMSAASASVLNDVIKGSKTGNFKDTFYGGAGNDKLWGGYGNDTLWGGTGKDTFVFDGKLGTSKTDRRVNYDTIKDYSVKDDSIWLENTLFKSNKTLYAAIKKGTESKPLKMASKFFTVGDKAKQADDYFVYDAKKRVLYYDADGSGSKAAIEMATFTNNKALKSFKATELFFI